MTRYTIRAAPPEHFDWLHKRSSCELSAGFRAVEALEVGRERYCRLCGLYHGRIGGMVGYNGWTPNSVAMHMALDTPGALKALLQPAFEYPFLQCGKGVVIGVTPGGHEAALKLSRHVGFREVARLHDAWSPGVDVVISELRRADCRWLKENP